MTTVADRIKQRMLDLEQNPQGGGQSWLAKKVGMKPQGVQSILAGRSEHPRKIREIAVALRTTPEYLLGETDDPKNRMVSGDTEILALLSRIEGLSDDDIDVVFAVIKNALGAKRGGSEP